MNFTAILPKGKTKAEWIASLPKGTIFCTRRTMKCANCGKNSLKHTMAKAGCLCCPMTMKGLEHHSKVWQPLPPKLKVGNPKHKWTSACFHTTGSSMKCEVCGIGKMEATRNGTPCVKTYAIGTGRGKKAICECGHGARLHLSKEHLCSVCHITNPMRNCHGYTPLRCELVSVMNEEEWLKKTVKYTKECEEEDNKFGRAIGELIHVDLLCRPNTMKQLSDFYDLMREANREGFDTYEQLNKWIEDHYKGRPKMWRYEFRR